MRKTKEALLAEITELEKALSDKQAEYNAALEAGQPAGELLINLTRLQNKLNVNRFLGNIEIVIYERSDVVNEAMAERERKLQELRESQG